MTRPSCPGRAVLPSAMYYWVQSLCRQRAKNSPVAIIGQLIRSLTVAVQSRPTNRDRKGADKLNYAMFGCGYAAVYY